MSDIKLFDLEKNMLIKKTTIFDVKEIIEKHLKNVFHISLVAKDYVIDESSNDVISYIGLDENMQIVIIEYRYGKFGSLTNKGLFYIDYIKEHISRFKMLFNEYQKGMADSVNYKARLLVLCDDANRYDHYAIKQLPYMIELIQLHIFEGKIAFEKVYQSMQIDHSALSVNLKTKPYYELYKQISTYLLSLGDEVVETGCGGFLIYRKINTFAYILLSSHLTLKLLVGDDYKTYEINTIDDFDSITDEVCRSYDEH